jgi:hypothetical protein
MRTIQKLEFTFSLIALFSAIVQVLFFIFMPDRSKDDSTPLMLIYSFLFVFIPIIIIIIGTYFHAFKENIIGFGVILLFSGTFICFYGFLFLVGFLTGREMKLSASSITWMIIWILPSFFVACTMIFAIINALKAFFKKDLI